MTDCTATILVTPPCLQAWLRGRRELALLDVREARAYVGAHLTLARMTPLSSLELDVPALVPRRATPVVLVDAEGADGPDGAGEAQGAAFRARALLLRLDYTDVRVLAGGIAGWRAAGLPVIDGYGSLVKAFGDRVRLHYATPALLGADLRARQSNGAATTLIDARPADEYAYLTLPGNANHAGTELALRAWPSSAPDAPAAPWVVNCFSRTRGILGATTLRVLGHPDARFLEDGVMRWTLDGAPTVEDARPAVELPTAPAHELRRRADGLIERHGLPLLRPDALARLHAETDRTLYLFDLRPAAAGIDDGESGGLVRAVAGGQLLMHFENLVGTRGARIVLLDEPHRLRAAVTAFWLTQLGQAEVFILDGEPPPLPRREQGQGDGHDMADDEAVLPLALSALLNDASPGVDIVDVGPSADYERQHLPRAHFLLPFTWAPLDALQQPGRRLIFTSPDGRAARLAAREANQRWPHRRAGWLAGGTRAWRAAGLPTERHWETWQLLTPFEDDWGSVMRMPAARRGLAWSDYLAWERGLSERVARDPTVEFRLFDMAGQESAKPSRCQR